MERTASVGPQGQLEKAQRWYDVCLSEDIWTEAGALRRLGEALTRQGDTEGKLRWLTYAAARGDDRARQQLAGT